MYLRPPQLSLFLTILLCIPTFNVLFFSGARLVAPLAFVCAVGFANLFAILFLHYQFPYHYFGYAKNYIFKLYTFYAICFFGLCTFQLLESTLYASFRGYIFFFYFLGIPLSIVMFNSRFTVKPVFFNKSPIIIASIFILTAALAQLFLALFSIYLKFNFTTRGLLFMSQNNPFDFFPFLPRMDFIRNFGSAVPSVFGERVQLNTLSIIFLTYSLYVKYCRPSLLVDWLKNGNSKFILNYLLVSSVIVLFFTGSSTSKLVFPVIFGIILASRKFKVLSSPFRILYLLREDSIRKIPHKVMIFASPFLLSLFYFMLVSVLADNFASIVYFFDSGARLSSLTDISSYIQQNTSFQKLFFGVGILPTSMINSSSVFEGTLLGLTGFAYMINAFGLLGLSLWVLTLLFTFDLMRVPGLINIFITTLCILAHGSPLDPIYLIIFSLTYCFFGTSLELRKVS